jgi:hypothetical protein
MPNHQSQTTPNFRPTSTSDVLPPVQNHIPACRRTKTPAAPAAPPQNHETRNTERAASPASSIQNPEFSPRNLPTPTRASKPRTRNGKIARLPYDLRDMINRMLRNNIPHSRIVAALDEHNIKVTERNVSNWKTRGGYRDWYIEQDCALHTRLLQNNLTEHLRTHDASQLPEVGLQLAATQLSQLFLQPDIQQQLTSDPDKYARAIALLCRLSRQIHNLQKDRDDSAKELGS